MNVEYRCEQCGKAFFRHPSQTKGKEHLFCSQACLAEFRKNGGYPKTLHPHLSEYNRKHNAERMTPAVRAKLRKARLREDANPDIYRKFYGKAEHRIIAEQMLGRPLKAGEVVHHINGNKRDNRPENLMVLQNASEHLKWHREHDPRFKRRKKSRKR